MVHVLLVHEEHDGVPLLVQRYASSALVGLRLLVLHVCSLVLRVGQQWWSAGVLVRLLVLV